MTRINYFFRNGLAGYSIESVFKTIISAIQTDTDIEKTFMPSPFADSISILRNGIYARIHQRKQGVNHITGDIHYLLYFLDGRRTVVTVHDIMYYDCLKGIKKKIWKRLYIDSLKKAACITFISDFAKSQVLNEISLPEEKMKVIPNPVDTSFVFSPKEFNEQKPRILHIGTLERKNLNRTIDALKNFPCHLRIIGRLDNKTIAKLKDSGIEYSNDCDLSHDEIVKEYRMADIVNFPSTCEGFGMPVIEAQATGRIVITSDISPMKDVAGEAAFLVNPYSVECIRDAYLRIIADKTLRKKLLEKGLENVAKFKYEAIAGQYMEIYSSLSANENLR